MARYHSGARDGITVTQGNKMRSVINNAQLDRLLAPYATSEVLMQGELEFKLLTQLPRMCL